MPLEFAVFAHEPFAYQRIGADVRRMRSLGMTLHAIGAALGVDEKAVRNAIRMSGKITPSCSEERARRECAPA